MCRKRRFSVKLGEVDVGGAGCGREARNQTTAGAVSVAWFVLKQPDELVQNCGVFSPCFGN